MGCVPLGSCVQMMACLGLANKPWNADSSIARKWSCHIALTVSRVGTVWGDARPKYGVLHLMARLFDVTDAFIASSVVDANLCHHIFFEV